MSTNPEHIILVVEDEIFIRMSTVDALADHGYDVLEAGDAAEALELLERTPVIALIFTDINMPGDVDGIGLARAVASRWPNTRIILTSGARQLRDADVPDGGIFLGKPYSTEHLVSLVREQLS